MSVHNALAKKVSDFELKYGIKPSRAYFGDEEITALLQWAFDNQYICVRPEDAEITGQNRPEVLGLLVYVVNDKNHLEVG